MSVAIPKISVQFSSVTPPQGDVLELRVHLGCTNEVSSFDCLLQNFDKEYSPGETNAINVGDSATISIGRGETSPLILTGRVEEIEPESTPVENYIRVKGRCVGEQIFRRVVNERYENQKGEAIVKDLLDNYVGLSHVRDSVELVEDTDTTYTLLEYADAKVFDILKYIAESADKSGVIGFDFRVDWDGKFAFFPKNTKTSSVSLSEKIENTRYSKDIHRIRNKIYVRGTAEKPYPLDTDGQPWSDSLTEDLTKPDNYLQHDDGRWDPVPSEHVNVDIETTIVYTGSKSVKVSTSAIGDYLGLKFTFDADKYVNGDSYPQLCFSIRENDECTRNIIIKLKDKDDNTCFQNLSFGEYDKWQAYTIGVGRRNQESWTLEGSTFDWENIKKIYFHFYTFSSSEALVYVDRMHFGGCRWSATEEDSGSQSSYGLRELVEVDEELHSDHECELRAKALLDHLSQPAEFLTIRTTCLDYGTDRLLPGDKIHVTIPNENIDDDYRIITVEYRVTARDQTLEITLELGKEKPLLADYLYGLRSTTITVEKLMRTKAGVTGGAGGGGGGGGGGGMVQHGNEWHDPDFSETGHTHVEADITDLDHDAQKIKGKTVDDAAIGDDKILVYKTTGDKIVYEAKPAGGGDMLKSVYDTDEDDIVDNSEKLEGSTKAQVQDHAPNTHGADKHDHTTWFACITPLGAILPASNAPAQTKVTGTNFTYYVLDFDKTTPEMIYGQFKLPPNYTPGSDLKVVIQWISTVTSGDVKWGAQILGRADAEAYDAALSTEATQTTTTDGTAGNINTSEVTISSPALAAEDIFIVKIRRIADDGADTMDADARMIMAGIKL